MDGPVASLFGEHRPAQLQAAIEETEFIEQFAFQEPNTIPVMLQEQPGGLGKTTVNGVVGGLDALINKRRSIISTFRRNLRAGYMEEAPLINQVIEQTLMQLGAKQLYRPVKFAEYKSATSFVSPSKVAALRQRLSEGAIMRPDRELVTMFVEWFDSAGGEETPVEFSDWYDQPEITDSMLPLGYSEQELCLGTSDRTSEAWQQWRRDRADDLETADVVLVTHAMLIRNSVSRGRVMRTDQEDSEIFRSVGALIIDESDKLPSVAQTSLTFSISSALVQEVLIDAEAKEIADRHAQTVLQSSRNVLTEALDSLKEYLVGEPRQRVIGVYDAESDEYKDAIDRLQRLDDALWQLRRIALGYYSPDDSDVILADQIRLMLEQLRAMLAGREHPLMKIEIFNDLDGEFHVRISVNFAAGRGLVNQLWRPVNNDPVPLHAIGVVVMVSAALTDRPPHSDRYQRFTKLLGVDDQIDRIHRKAPILRPQPEAIRHVIVIERNPRLHPTDESAPFMLSSAWVKAVTAAIRTVAAEQRRLGQDTKSVVLFHSHAALRAVFSALPRDVRGSVVTLNGRDWQAAMRELAEVQHGMWFGTEWEGSNFIDPESFRTMADILVLTRIPQPPMDMVRRERVQSGLMLRRADRPTSAANSVVLHESVEVAYRRMRQGLMRPLRREGDTIQQLYILDIRFPVPDWVVTSYGGVRTVKSAGDAKNLFRGFDQILRPFEVEQWSQIDGDGVISPIVP